MPEERQSELRKDDSQCCRQQGNKHSLAYKLTHNLRSLRSQYLADADLAGPVLGVEAGPQAGGGLAQAHAVAAAVERLWEAAWSRIAEIVNEEYKEVNPEFRTLIAEYFYQRLQANIHRRVQRRLASFIEQYRSDTSRRPQLQREENRLIHEVETNRSIYQAFLESKTSAQITEAMHSTDLGVKISIMEPAEKSTLPVRPNALKIMIMALIFGCACGGGSILLTEYMDDSFRSVEEVQRVLKSPVLGTIPRTVAHFAWERRRRGRIILAWIVGLFLFMSIVSGAMYLYARKLESMNIGVELSEDLIGR